MNKITSALNLASQGFFVFPLRVNSKLPAVKEWQHKATRDVEQIKKWWELNPDFNIGVATEFFGDGKALLVVDVDTKQGKVGAETFEAVKGMLNKSEMYEVQTATGGRHLFYLVDEPVRSGVNVLGKDIDIRSAGGYVVGAGSEIDGNFYEWV